MKVVELKKFLEHMDNDAEVVVFDDLDCTYGKFQGAHVDYIGSTKYLILLRGNPKKGA